MNYREIPNKVSLFFHKKLIDKLFILHYNVEYPTNSEMVYSLNLLEVRGKR